MSTTDEAHSEPLRVPLSDQLGLEPERAAFEAWKRKHGGHYMSRNNAPGSDLSGYQDAHTQGQWEAWKACWPLARAAIYAAEQTKPASERRLDTTVRPPDEPLPLPAQTALGWDYGYTEQQMRQYALQEVKRVERLFQARLERLYGALEEAAVVLANSGCDMTAERCQEALRA